MKRKGSGAGELDFSTKQIVLRGNSSSSSVGRRLPLLAGQDLSSRGTARPISRPITTTSSCSCGATRVAEVAGGTTAECAAVFCCFPCGLVNLLLLAIYKLPAGLYRKALRKRRRRRLIKNGSALSQPVQSFNQDEPEVLFRSPSTSMTMTRDFDSDKDVLEMEEEMWGKFYSSGFWRSTSQKSDGGEFIYS